MENQPAKHLYRVTWRLTEDAPEACAIRMLVATEDEIAGMVDEAWPSQDCACADWEQLFTYPAKPGDVCLKQPRKS